MILSVQSNINLTYCTIQIRYLLDTSDSINIFPSKDYQPNHLTKPNQPNQNPTDLIFLTIILV